MKKILFICSPSITLLDNVLPLFKELKKKKYEIDMLLPKTGNLLDYNLGNNLFKISKNIFKNISLIRENNLNNVLKFKFNDFAKVTKNNIFLNKILFLISKIFNKENNLINTFLIEKYVATKLIWHTKNYEKINSFFQSYDLIFYDITEENKKYFSFISKLIFNKKKISIYHGSDYKLFSKFKNINKKSLNCHQFLWSNNPGEKKFYSHQFNLKKYIVTGNPKFDRSWIKHFSKKKKFFKNNRKTVLLVSRESNNFYFPLSHKIKVLKDIKKIIFDKYKLNLIIKLHPRENSEVGKRLYFDIFGSDFFKKNWTFSNENPYTLGKSVYFAICFYSGLSIDLINLNKPTIEYLIINNKIKKKNKYITFTKNKINNFQIAHQKLVLPAKNEVDLDKFTESILKKRYFVIKKIKLRFKKNYKTKNILKDSILAVSKIISYI